MKFDDIFKQSYGHLTGDEVMAKLKTLPEKTVVFADRGDEYSHLNKKPVNWFGSWRGSYAYPTCHNDSDTEYTPKELLGIMEKFFQSVQHGYKGGEYQMDSRLEL